MRELELVSIARENAQMAAEDEHATTMREHERRIHLSICTCKYCNPGLKRKAMRDARARMAAAMAAAIGWAAVGSAAISVASSLQQVKLAGQQAKRMELESSAGAKRRKAKLAAEKARREALLESKRAAAEQRAKRIKLEKEQRVERNAKKLRAEEQVAGAVGLGHALLDVLDGKSVTFSESDDSDPDQLDAASDAAQAAEGGYDSPNRSDDMTNSVRQLTRHEREAAEVDSAQEEGQRKETRSTCQKV